VEKALAKTRPAAAMTPATGPSSRQASR
jgi:hypothetical protein